MNMHTVDTIHTIPIESNQTSNTLICSEYQQNVPIAFKNMSPMDYALLACFEGLPDGINMELISVKSWNQSVLRIQSDNQQQLTTLKHDMINKFKYVLYECESIKNNHNQFIYNAKNHTDNRNYKPNRYQQHNNNNNVESHYDYSDNDADEESGNDDYFEHALSHKTNRFKKNAKQIKKERAIRDLTKCKQQTNNKNKNKNIQRKSDQPMPGFFTESTSNSSEQKVSEELQYTPSNSALVPTTPSSETESDNSYHHHPPINNPSSLPIPNFNFELNIQQQKPHAQPQNKTKRPSLRILPVFDFSFGVGLLGYDNTDNNNTVSDNRSSMDYLSADPKFADGEYLSSPPPPSHHHDFGIKLQYNRVNRPKHVHIYIIPPVLPIFGDSQSQQEYLDFHENSRRQYSQKLKTSPKPETHPKNYFLLPILTKLDYQIGAQMGVKDYGFYTDFGLNNGSLTGRDSNFYHGVDFEVIQSKKEKKHSDKTAASFLLEVMQVSKQRSYGWHDNVEYYGNGYGNGSGVFQNKFVINNHTIAFGEGRSKAEARQICSENALELLRTDANYTHFRNIIQRKEAGVKVNNNKELVVGYEYPVVLPPRRYRHFKAKYVYQPILAIHVHDDKKSQNHIHLQRKQRCAYDVNIGKHKLDVFMDRGYIGGNALDNPNVEELYARNWARFKGEYNIPKQSHEYIDGKGKLIKLLDWKERELWTAIWNFYEVVDVSAAKLKAKSKSNSVCSNSECKDNGNINHFIIYDFDGTVYAQRLYRECSKINKNPHEYISELSAGDIRRIGWKLERIKPLKKHFNALRKCKPYLGTVLHTFHSKESLNQLFAAINVNMNDYFDIVLYHGCEIVNYVNKQKKNGQRYSKERMIQMLCSKYNVLTENVLYVDDDPKIKKVINCCQVFITKQRNGISEEEMREIESIIVAQWKLGGGYHYKENMNKKIKNKNNGNNGNNRKGIKKEICGIKMEICIACTNSFPIKQMKVYEDVLLCSGCYYNNCDRNRMNMIAANQYHPNNNNNYQHVQ